MNAGSLEIQLYANVARLTQDMAQVERTVTGAMGKVEAAAKGAMAVVSALGVGLTVASFANMIRGALDAADALNKLQARTGVTTESLSQLQYAANMAGVANESLSNAMRKLNVAIASGLAGDREKVLLFRQLGVTTADLGKGTEEVMLKMADGFAKSKDGAGKVSVALALMGKTGDEMIPLLNGGAEALKGMMQEADKLGLTIGQNFAAQAEAFNDNLERVHRAGSKFAILMAGQFVDGVGRALDAMAKATIEAGKFAGVIAGMQTLLTGDDRHKANVAIVDKAEQILKVMDLLDKARVRAAEAPGRDKAAADAEVARLAKKLEYLRREVKTHQQYAQVMDDQAAAEKAAADAAEERRKQNELNAEKAKQEAERQKAAAEELKRQVKAGTELAASLIAQDGGLSPDFLKKWDQLALARKAGAVSAEQLIAAQANLLAQQPLMKKQLDEALAEAKERQKLRAADDAAVRQALQDIEAERIASLKSVTDRVASLKDEAEAAKLAADLNVSLAEAVEMVAIARLREKQERMIEGAEAWEAVEREIAARRELLALIKRREELRQYQDMWASIDRTAHDV